jgi:hypothetical protein
VFGLPVWTLYRKSLLAFQLIGLHDCEPLMIRRRLVFPPRKAFLAYVALSFFSIVASVAAQTSFPTTAADTVDPQHVMAAFHEAVVTHDGARLAALVIPEGSTWLNVLSDSAFARIRLTKPDAAKVRVSSFKDFATFVSSTKQKLDPWQTHLILHTDGTIASAYFDYAFYIDGKEENHGSETWQLVKGENGWRIAAISYSSDPTVHP